MGQRYHIFLFPRNSLVFSHFWGISNEWMKKPFFFISSLFFFSAHKFEWMNDPNWPMNFSVEKKKNKKHTLKCGKKKKHKQVFLKKSNVVKIWLNDRWTFPGKKKNKLYFFFPASRKKKKHTIFGFEWMNDQRPCPCKKKIRYLCSS